MFQKIKSFMSDYKQVTVTIAAIIIALPLDLAGYDSTANWILGVTAIVMVVPLLIDMVHTLRSGKYGIDVLAATAIITAVLLGEYWAAIIVVLMITGGESLEDYAENRAKSELTDLLKRRPKKARLVKGKKIVEVKVSQITGGDKIVIAPGEVVPVDGEVIEGETSLDESSLTGESLPQTKAVGDQVLSGSINKEGEITVKALRSAKNSQYEQIITLVRNASKSESPFVRLADRYSVPFTISAYFIAGSVWIISGDPVRFLEVMVVATPCPLILGAPIALVSGMSRAAKHGIIVKNGSTLERLAEVKAVAFDKTGTLTTGDITVNKVTAYNNFKSDTVLADAAAIEQSSNHILGSSIINAALKKKLKLQKAKNVKEVSGHGLVGKVQNRNVLIGKLDLLASHDIDTSAIKNTATSSTQTFVAINGKLAGKITFIDTPRPESKKVVSQLKKLGITWQQLVTGDNQLAAEKVAKQVGITNITANCLPADKIHELERSKHRPIAFVGDGINDAPVLTTADVGIAMGAKGSTAASEAADVVVMQDSLASVYSAFAIAKRTFSVARQAIFIGIFLSVALMLIFATGRFEAVQGALLQEVVDIAVIVYALRAHSDSKKFQLS